MGQEDRAKGLKVLKLGPFIRGIMTTMLEMKPCTKCGMELHAFSFDAHVVHCRRTAKQERRRRATQTATFVYFLANVADRGELEALAAHGVVAAAYELANAVASIDELEEEAGDDRLDTSTIIASVLKTRIGRPEVYGQFWAFPAWWYVWLPPAILEAWRLADLPT